MKTLHDRLAAGLTALGERQLNHAGRYTKFTCVNRPGAFYFIGRNGALRIGSSVGNSSSLTNGRGYLGVLAAGDRALKPDA